MSIDEPERCKPTAPKRYLLNPSGTAGDIHPYIAFGCQLRNRGHEVYVLTNPLFKNLIEQYGLIFVPIGQPMQWSDIRNDNRIHKSSESWQAIKWGAVGTMREVFTQIQRLCEPQKTVLVSPPWCIGARIARDALSIPLASIVLNPVVLRSKIRAPRTPSMYLPDWMPRWMKRYQYWIADTFFIDPLIGKEINGFLAELGLPSAKRFMNGWWFSPDLVLGLFDEWFVQPQPDWPTSVTCVGHTLWDPPGDESICGNVEAFLDSGEKPICFVPGSVGPGRSDYYEIAAKACAATNSRGLILDRVDLDTLPALPETMHVAAYVPLREVLPRCSAIVHSGCMGTSVQAMAAGIPQLVRPCVNDQPDIAARLRRLGVAEVISPKQFEVQNVQNALQRIVSNQAMMESCRLIAARIKPDQASNLIADRLEDLA